MQTLDREDGTKRIFSNAREEFYDCHTLAQHSRDTQRFCLLGRGNIGTVVGYLNPHIGKRWEVGRTKGIQLLGTRLAGAVTTIQTTMIESPRNASVSPSFTSISPNAQAANAHAAAKTVFFIPVLPFVWVGP